MHRFIEDFSGKTICSDEKTATDLGLHTELDIKSEPEEELKEEPQDSDDGAPPTDELQFGTTGTIENQIVEHLAADIESSTPSGSEDAAACKYIPKGYKKTNKSTKEVNDSDANISNKVSEDCTVDTNYVLLNGMFNNSHENIGQHMNLSMKYSCKNKVDKPFICRICDEKLYDIGRINDHIKIHKDEKLVCKQCDKKFSHISNLNAHNRIHTGEKPYFCKFCDKKFTHRSSLNNHIRIHTGERPHVCEICNKKFAQKGNLTCHMRVHK